MKLLRYKKLLENHMEDGFVYYFSLLLIFVFGVAVGSLMTKLLDTGIQETILDYSSVYYRYINKGVNDVISIFKISLAFRLTMVIIIYIAGLLKLGVLPPILIFVQGSALGFNVAYIIYNFGFKGFWISIFSFSPQHALFIPSFIILGALSMSMAAKQKISANKSIVKIKKISVFDYTTFNIIFLFIIILGTLYEGFIAPIFLKSIT